MKLSIALASAVAANVVEKVDEVTTEATGTTSPPFHPDGKHPCEPNDERDKFNGGTFPENFIWSIGSNAYNIEGGWNAAGKGNSIWDEYANGRFTREEVDEFWANDNGRHENAEPQQDQICLDAGKTDCWCKVDDCMDGNTAANSWAHMDRDIENLKSLGIKSYRFSLSWSRLMPDGINPNTNPEGAEYYHTLLDKLIEAGIDPIVALYAYDLPAELSKNIEIGDDDDYWDQCFGWTCYEIIGHFTEYARYAFTEYGDKVKNWITMVEPAVMADRGYGDCSFPPAYPEICNNQAQFAERTARHNALQAHVAAYHLYKNEFNGADGKCGIILNSRWAQANDETKPEDVAAAEREMALYVGWFADPIFGNGTYSDTLREMLEGADEWTQMYEFTEEQAALNAGSADFFAINHYNTMLVQANENEPYGYEVLPPCEQWEATGSTWNNLAPWGMRRILWWIHQHYDSTKYPIWITENGLATIDGDEDGDHDGESDPLNDWFRIDHLNAYMGQTLRAIIEDGANVEMYTAWSLMDGFEWNRGYTERFGLFYTNFTELDATTTPKRSADWYAKVIHYNCAPGTNENCFPQEIPDSNSTDIPSTDGPDPTDPTSNAVTLAASTLLSALLALFL